MKFFENWKIKYFGIVFEGVQIILKNKNNFIVGEYADNRKKIQKYDFDFGAAGMIPFGKTPRKTAEEELHEECGITGDIKYYNTYTPYDKINCVVHIFYIDVDNINILNSDDGTYIRFFERSYNDIVKSNMIIKKDAKVFLSKFVNN